MMNIMGKRMKGVAPAEVLLAFVQSWELHGSDETSICSGTLDLLRAYLGDRPACVWKNTGPGLSKITERGMVEMIYSGPERQAALGRALVSGSPEFDLCDVSVTSELRADFDGFLHVPIKSHGQVHALLSMAATKKEARDRGLTMVPPFDHRLIIVGQATTGLEILEQCPDVGTVFVPAGGGGLVSGVSAAIKQSNPSVRIVAVEPAGAPKVTRSLEAGHPVTLDSSASIADGLMNLRPGDLTFAHIQKFVDEVVTVSEADIAAAVAWLFRNARIVAEPSGAITTAAVSLGLGHPVGKVVAIVTGGNVAPEKFAKYIAD